MTITYFSIWLIVEQCTHLHGFSCFLHVSSGALGLMYNILLRKIILIITKLATIMFGT